MASRAKPQEPTYTRADLIAAARGFGVTPEVMAGALRLAGREEYTRAEVEAALNVFRGRKV